MIPLLILLCAGYSEKLKNVTVEWPAYSCVSRSVTFGYFGIWVPSKSASTSTSKDGNAPVASLVSHGVVGGGDHLPSGDLYVHMPCLSIKKNKYSVAAPQS